MEYFKYWIIDKLVKAPAPTIYELVIAETPAGLSLCLWEPASKTGLLKYIHVAILDEMIGNFVKL